MKLRGIDFGHVLDASGARNWFGEGYPFHRYVPGLNFDGSTFVAKTTTLHPHRGYADMRRDGTRPRILGQRAVKVNWFKGVALNALGLPGPGFRALLDQGNWQRLQTPFFLSFMAIGASLSDNLNEVREFVRILKAELPRFSAPVGLQINFSCPNVLPREHLANFNCHLDEYQTLGIPIMPKLSATTSIDVALAIGKHPSCDAICISNTIPWGELPDTIDWRGLFGVESPLKEYGGGGLSGAPLLSIVAEWVRDARRQGLTKPINAGGGILKPADVDVLLHAGASSVFVGSIAILRGWRLQRTINHANRAFSTQMTQGQEVATPALRRA